MISRPRRIRRKPQRCSILFLISSLVFLIYYYYSNVQSSLLLITLPPAAQPSTTKTTTTMTAINKAEEKAKITPVIITPEKTSPPPTSILPEIFINGGISDKNNKTTTTKSWIHDPDFCWNTHNLFCTQKNYYYYQEGLEYVYGNKACEILFKLRITRILLIGDSFMQNLRDGFFHIFSFSGTSIDPNDYPCSKSTCRPLIRPTGGDLCGGFLRVDGRWEVNGFFHEKDEQDYDVILWGIGSHDLDIDEKPYGQLSAEGMEILFTRTCTKLTRSNSLLFLAPHQAILDGYIPYPSYKRRFFDATSQSIRKICPKADFVDCYVFSEILAHSMERLVGPGRSEASVLAHDGIHFGNVGNSIKINLVLDYLKKYYIPATQ